MVTTFRADIGKENLAGMKDNLNRILDSRTTEEQYERFLTKFEKSPTVPGEHFGRNSLTLSQKFNGTQLAACLLSLSSLMAMLRT